MNRSNQFTEKFQHRSDEELIEILESDSHAQEARFAAQWILEERLKEKKLAPSAEEVPSLAEEGLEETATDQFSPSSSDFAGKAFYTEKQVMAAAFFGGPLPVGILIFKNLIRLRRERTAYLTLLSTIIFSMALIYAIIYYPNGWINQMPDMLFSTLMGGIFVLVYHLLLADEIKKAIQIAATVESNWKVVIYTLFGIVVLLSFAFLLAFFEPVFPDKKIAYEGGNELYYDSNSSQKDVNYLAEELFNSGYFQVEYPGIARLQTDEGQYTVTLLVIQQSWSDEVLISNLNSLKIKSSIELNKKVSLRLLDYDINGKEIYHYVD